MEMRHVIYLSMSHIPVNDKRNALEILGELIWDAVISPFSCLLGTHLTD